MDKRSIQIKISYARAVVSYGFKESCILIGWSAVRKKPYLDRALYFSVFGVRTSLVPRRFIMEKNGLIQSIYTDHLQIERARKGAWGGRTLLSPRRPQAPLRARSICKWSVYIAWINFFFSIKKRLGTRLSSDQDIRYMVVLTGKWLPF